MNLILGLPNLLYPTRITNKDKRTLHLYTINRDKKFCIRNRNPV